ncbi:chorismate synthase [Chitinibacter fontanus]|uniref:Chorismate synthase n=1 Tax=Chitinibacter fontanus TaxID=1737446 RepID=A0A7D5ZHK7_9NEIS|nr:chorismate synthase [Chitinibacter fontanus]QLI80690.1 chorismate synthase [Chitinibacter fontanus]
MSGNSLGLLFTVTSFGESHGAGIGCIVDGCPPGMDLSLEDIQFELDRRKPGTSRHVTQRKEPDTVEILSGIYEGKTTGTPIALLIRNQDQRSQDYGKIVETFRPGHADYTYWHKYGIRDPRGGGRSSARETAVRVAAGAIAKKWLREKFGIVIRGYMSKLGEIDIPFQSWDHVSENAFFAPNAEIVPQLEDYMDAIRKERDSVGAQISVVAENVPVGWGEPVYDRLDAEIAYAMMNINAVKGVEIGAGFDSIAQRGSVHCDELTPNGFATNHAGGILGGISTGQAITVNLAVKPTSSIAQERQSIDKMGSPVMMATTGRHDPCVGIRATPIAEAMLALVLIDHALRHRAQCGDVVVNTPKIPGKIA